jgi:negative regulator of sigma E activity
MHPPDELDEYLRGGSALSRQYRKASAPMPPPGLERRVLQAAAAQPPYLAPLAFAASVLLSVAVVLAIVFGPQPAKHRNETPRLVRTAAHAGLAPNAPLSPKLELYSSDPPRVRAAAQWLADIEALRRAGRNSEADAELRGFRRAYPDHAGGERKLLP